MHAAHLDASRCPFLLLLSAQLLLTLQELRIAEGEAELARTVVARATAPTLISPFILIIQASRARVPMRIKARRD